MVWLNGQEIPWTQEVDLYRFLEANNYDPKLVVVEADKNLVKRVDYKTFMVQDQMALEVFAFIGGG